MKVFSIICVLSALLLPVKLQDINPLLPKQAQWRGRWVQSIRGQIQPNTSVKEINKSENETEDSSESRPRINFKLPAFNLKRPNISFSLPKINISGTANKFEDIFQKSFNISAIKKPKFSSNFNSSKLSNIKVPEIDLSDLKLPTINLTDLPNLDLPQLDFPKVDFDNFELKINLSKLPELDFDEIKFPEIDLARLEFPEVDFDELKLPKLNLSKLQEQMNFDNLELPELNLDELDLSSLNETREEFIEFLEKIRSESKLPKLDASGMNLPKFNFSKSQENLRELVDNWKLPAFDWSSVASNDEEPSRREVVPCCPATEELMLRVQTLSEQIQEMESSFSLYIDETEEKFIALQSKLDSLLMNDGVV